MVVAYNSKGAVAAIIFDLIYSGPDYDRGLFLPLTQRKN